MFEVDKNGAGELIVRRMLLGLSRRELHIDVDKMERDPPLGELVMDAAKLWSVTVGHGTIVQQEDQDLGPWRFELILTACGNPHFATMDVFPRPGDGSFHQGGIGLSLSRRTFVRDSSFNRLLGDQATPLIAPRWNLDLILNPILNLLKFARAGRADCGRTCEHREPADKAQ